MTSSTRIRKTIRKDLDLLALTQQGTPAHQTAAKLVESRVDALIAAQKREQRTPVVAQIRDAFTKMAHWTSELLQIGKKLSHRLKNAIRA